MHLQELIQTRLNDLAPELAVLGDGDRTQRVNKALREVARRFALAEEIGFGTDFSKAAQGNELVIVHVKDRHLDTRAEYLFDQCGLRFHCDPKEERTFEDGDPIHGYLLRCELAAETEWSCIEENLHYDFRKLVLARAKLKLFVFQISPRYNLQDVLARFQNQIDLFEEAAAHDTYLISCFNPKLGSFDHYVRVRRTKA